MDTPSPSTPGSSRGVALKLGVSVLLAGAFVWALRPYLSALPSDLDVSAAVLLGYLATLLPYHLLRAGRWVLLLRPLGETLPPTREVLRIGLAGYMWIALMPFRLGEFARPMFLAQRSDVRVSQSLGTVAIERAVDGVMVCALFFVGMAGATPEGDTELLYLACYGVMGAFTVALAGMLAAARWPAQVASLADRLVRWASPRLATWARDTVHGVADGFAALPNIGAIAGFVVATAGYWAANAAGMWLLAQGCGLDLSLGEAVATLAIMNLALLVPGGPAQLGVFQSGIALALHLFVPADVVQTAGSKFAFFLYVCQLGTIVTLGLTSQWSLSLDWRAALRGPRKK
ncbi:MAG: lysylphosphatidylglycerol synthase transmembrane domain-containing protein [Myxococcota bacterium]